jgi:ATP-dependent Clp protease ATP-binding subunit ClpB
VAEKRRKFGRDFGEGSVRLVLFKRLPQPEIERIADLMFNDLCTWLAERRITLDPTEDAALHPQAGFDPVYGARPLRPFIAREVETPIGHALLAGEFHGAVIRVGLHDGEIAVTCDSPGAGQQRGAEQPQLSSQ